MKHLPILATSLCIATSAFSVDFETAFPDLPQEEKETYGEYYTNVDFIENTASVGNDIATFNLGENFYYLNAEDARYVLEELWGNPEDTSVLGMVFPAGQHPLIANWGAVVSFDDIGYVDDKDATSYNYDDLLKTMQADTRDENEWRVQNGYETVELVGWVEEPYYDQEKKTLFWGKELKFATNETNTMNYNMRILGRQGVMIIDFIGETEMLQDAKSQMPQVIAMTEFTPGNRYSDFNPSVDKIAAVGIGGLIAGKVLAKTGLLVMILLALKKFWFVFIAMFIGIGRLFKKKG